jgi:hypothetical protein
MALDAAEVRHDEDVGHNLGVGLGHAEGREDSFAERAQSFLLDDGSLGHRDAPVLHDHEQRLWV